MMFVIRKYTTWVPTPGGFGCSERGTVHRRLWGATRQMATMARARAPLGAPALPSAARSSPARVGAALGRLDYGTVNLR